jgi:hypothetical protein
MKYRTSGNIRTPEVYRAIQDILFESPELEKNEWLKHRDDLIEVIENEDARAPPLSHLFEEEKKEVNEDQHETGLVKLLIDEIREKAKKEETEDE